MTYIEAMAAGLPVVAKEDPCLEDILEYGYNGYTFTNQEEFIAGLDHILYDGMNYVSQAISKVRKYSSEEYAANVVRVYESIIHSEPMEEQRNEAQNRKISRLSILNR